jgi:hypothetical protein
MANVAELAFPQEAYDLLVERVHKPVFLEKLARAYGIVPEGPAEEQALLELAGVLRQHRDSEVVKQAAAGQGSFIVDAVDSLKQGLNQLGYQPLPTSYDRLVKQAAQQLSFDPQVAGAVESFGTYLGQLQAQATQHGA